jgi:hypothetical protein
MPPKMGGIPQLGSHFYRYRETHRVERLVSAAVLAIYYGGYWLALAWVVLIHL